MPIIEKKYHFAIDTEGWTGFVGNEKVIATLIPKVYSLPPLNIYGSCLRMIATRGAAASENYWELETTWEQIGVPAGKLVSSVNASYLYRWSLQSNNEGAEFGADEAATGPFELRNSAGNLVGTFSDRFFCISRTAENLWVGFPQDSNYPHTPFESTDFPIKEVPPSWGLKNGKGIIIPEAMRASNTTVIFRLRNLMPATLDIVQHRVRLKQDRILLTVTYGDVDISIKSKFIFNINKRISKFKPFRKFKYGSKN